MAVEILDVPMYSIGEAARFLEIQPGKLRRWLEGTRISGRHYPPVIRPSPTGSDIVTWAEFVEAGLLREYRAKRVSLQHVRPIIDAMRDRFGVPYPLAHFLPLVDPSNRRLVFEMQNALGLEAELRLVRGESGQIQWAPAVEAFLQKVTFDAEGIAERMHPLGRRSPVTIDPERVFGIPQIKGIRTETIGHALGIDDKSESEIAEEFGLTPAEVRAAIQWELRVGKRAS